MSAMRVTSPPTALITTPALMSPFAVRTPVTRSPSRRSPVTSVPWSTCTPRVIALCAYAHTTRSWRAVEPGTWYEPPWMG
jgi:hypothetical protein